MSIYSFTKMVWTRTVRMLLWLFQFGMTTGTKQRPRGADHDVQAERLPFHWDIRVR